VADRRTDGHPDSPIPKCPIKGSKNKILHIRLNFLLSASERELTNPCGNHLPNKEGLISSQPSKLAGILTTDCKL
jgi:hypothetical protein